MIFDGVRLKTLVKQKRIKFFTRGGNVWCEDLTTGERFLVGKNDTPELLGGNAE